LIASSSSVASAPPKKTAFTFHDSQTSITTTAVTEPYMAAMWANCLT
jgi:hypothetical protein